jgi:MFS family permease
MARPSTPQPARRQHLRAALAQSGFRRLFRTRLIAQFTDGVFQASLAGAVLFNPEHQAHASDVAAGFAIVLIPYSLIGPFAGVLLDRWRRQRVLVGASVVRGLVVLVAAAEIAAGVEGLLFYATALVVVSVSRFFLSALSASLPHVVDDDDLVTTNALSTTAGAVATTAGGAVAVGARALIGDGNSAYALVAVIAAGIYLIAALVPRPFGADELGPDDVERSRRETAADVVRGLVDGARHLHARPSASAALIAIGVHRLCYGVTTVCTILLYRNYFADDGVFRAGLGGLAQVVAAAAVGGGLAAAVTPAATRRLGYVRWPAVLLAGAAVAQLALGLRYTLPAIVAAAVLLGFIAQGIKICVDTLVQRDVEDLYRGRVFALYDTLVNVTLVAAALLTAVVLPENGHSPGSVVVIAVAYLLTAAAYLQLAPVTTAVASTTA